MKRIFILAFCFSLFACKSDLTVEIGLEGKVASDDGTINCSDACAREITGKQTITLTAINDSESYVFHHWEGACTSTDPICVLEIHPLLPFTVKAQFTYTGKTLGDIDFEDPNLLRCIQDARPDYQYRRAWLVTLDCAGWEIESLAGIEELDGFHSYFILNNNQISDLSPLEGRRFFNGLYLRNNAINDPAPLSSVQVYHGQILLGGNPNLDCETMQDIVDRYFLPRIFEVPQCDIPSKVDIPGDGGIVITFP